MYQRILFICLIALPASSKAQTDSASLVPFIREAADSMTAAFTRKDFRTFTTYNNATLVGMVGGEESFANFVENQVSSLKDLSFSVVRAGRILRVLPGEKPMQCLVEQLSEILYQGNYISVVSHLVGISTNGREWRFADANPNGGRDIRKMIPEMSPSLAIPQKKQVAGIRLDEFLKTYDTVY